MKNRVSSVVFPTNTDDISKLNQQRGHLEYGQYYYYGTFGKFIHIYKLFSDEKGISDEEIINQLKEKMAINGNSDCAFQLDKKLRYKKQGFSAKTFEGLKKLISEKIIKGNISYEMGYYILCRISDNYDFKGKIKDDINALLSIKTL